MSTRAGFNPGAQRRPGLLLQKYGLPIVIAQGGQIARVGEVKNLLARSLLFLACEMRQKVVPVEVHFVFAPDRLHSTFLELFLDVRCASGRWQATPGCPKGVFGGCDPEGAALKWRVNVLYVSRFISSILQS